MLVLILVFVSLGFLEQYVKEMRLGKMQIQPLKA